MNKRDFYEVLGISKTANESEIKKAYRSAAKKYHPDVNKEADAEAKFKEAQEAYEVLSDANKRAAYDQYGHAGVDPQAGGFGGQNFNGFSGGFGGFEDLFGDIFGGSSRRQSSNSGPRQGEDRFIRYTVTFMESVNGADVEIPLRVEQTCGHCHGTGGETPSDVTTCTTCHATGHVRQQQRTFFGVVESTAVCPDCLGTGKKVKTKCHVCHGAGYETKDIKVEVKIPAGIQTGQSLRVQGKGQRGANGGSNGDLYIEIVVQEHKHFKRQGNDVFIDVPVSAIDATLGTTIDVPTIYGDVSLKIPEGSQPEQQLRLKGKGFKDIRSSHRGDQLVRLKVVVPQKVSKKEKDLYKQLQELSKKDGDSIFDKFKKTFGI